MPTLRQWQTTHKDPSNFIVQASTRDGSDGWTTFPIGMGWSWKRDYSLRGDHQKEVLCAISTTTDKHRRPVAPNRESILKTLESNGIQNTTLSAEEYFKSLPSYKFVISPEGNGLDCHRHYEALMAGCIPIIERNSLIQKKYEGCPILWTTDYSEITEEYLSAMYSDMIDTEYNFSALFVSSYSLNKQTHIKMNSNFWMTKFTGTPYYGRNLLPFLRI